MKTIFLITGMFLLAMGAVAGKDYHDIPFKIVLTGFAVYWFIVYALAEILQAIKENK
jgi:uncharacterized membrane protein